jgi:hypothetical protein
MKIGLVFFEQVIASVDHVYHSTIEALQQEHELIYRPPVYAFRSKAWRKDAIRDMLLSCDVIVGCREDMVLQIRENIDKQIPYLCLVLGALPRGNPLMMETYSLFRTTDVLLVNCTSDVEIANNIRLYRIGFLSTGRSVETVRPNKIGFQFGRQDTALFWAHHHRKECSLDS